MKIKLILRLKIVSCLQKIQKKLRQNRAKLKNKDHSLSIWLIISILNKQYQNFSISFIFINLKLQPLLLQINFFTIFDIFFIHLDDELNLLSSPIILVHF